MSDSGTDRTRRPLLVTGMERSGTTLLAAMLSGHSRICHRVPPFIANLFSSWPDGVSGPEQLERFVDDLYGRTRFSGSPVPREALLARLLPRVPLAFRDLAAEVVAAHSAHEGKPHFVYWGDKTPLLVTVLHEDKARFDRVMGDYRLVAIIRDGRAVLSSVLRARATLGRGLRTDLFYLAAQWRKAAMLDALFPDGGQYLQVHYEHLVTRPAETLQAVCRFLDLSYEPRMLEYPRAANTSSIHRLVSASPQPDRIDAWHAEVDARSLRVFDVLARSALRRAGYAPLPAALRRGVAASLGETASYWLDTRVRHRLRRVVARAPAPRTSQAATAPDTSGSGGPGIGARRPDAAPRTRAPGPGH